MHVIGATQRDLPSVFTLKMLSEQRGFSPKIHT